MTGSLTSSSHDDHELLATAVEVAELGVCLVDASGEFVRANAAFCQMVGYGASEVLGHHWTMLFPPEWLSKADQFLNKLFGEASGILDEWRVLHQDGNLVRALVRCKPLPCNQDARCVMITFINIDQRKAASQQASQRSEDLYRKVVENVSEGIVVRQGVYWVFSNQRTCELTGYTKQEMASMSFTELVCSEDIAMMTERMNARVAGAEIERYMTFRLLRKDGTVLWVESSTVPIKWDGQPATLSFLSDLTERRRQEAALVVSEQHHRQVINNVTESILVAQEGRIVFSNPRLQKLIGMSPEELFTQPFSTFIHPEDRALVIDHHQRRIRGENVQEYYQFRVVNQKTGDICWMELSAVMIDWDGKPATLSFMTDITLRRLLEENLRLSAIERSRLETLQVQNELKEAEVARRHAEETTQAKSMFLANMSHEIRTPMNAIIGMAHLALRTELNNKQRDYVNKIHGAGISLLGIINDILDFSKIEAGKLDIEKIEFDLSEVLNNVATVTSDKAHEKGLEYLYQIPRAIPRKLVGDPLRLGQVLINLINNAIKFTEHGEIHIACIQRSVAAAGQLELEFIVRDTGIGMTAEQSGKLFHAFSQADGSTTRKYGGTGLGLSISKGMVELMGGTIWLESVPEHGTSIHFTAQFGLAADAPQAHIVPSALNGMRILVVDDNPVAVAILTEYLSGMPVEIDQAGNGQIALKMIGDCDRQRPYAVVFTDLRMPKMDGIELIGAVKMDSTLQAPPKIVLVSAYGREEVQARPAGAMADGYLMKPVSPSMLVDTLMALFSPASGEAERRAPRTLGTAVRFSDLKILLVEDNEINQQIAVELMEAAGISVDVAGNGRIALERLQQVGPECYGMVFMDVQMPEMDGHEATQLLRADARFGELTIVAMTAHAMVEERQRCADSGMNDHLTKPINPDGLYRTIRHWCPKHVRDPAERRHAAVADFEEELIIDGVDVQDGLRRTLGNRTFYLQMLGRFRDDQSDVVARMRSALEDKTGRVLAERLAHTLKGVAGQLGIRAVAVMADHAVNKIRHGEDLPALAPLLDQLDGDMQALHLALTKVLSDASANAPAALPEGPINQDDVQRLVRRIADLLRSYDGDAIDLLDESQARLASILGAAAQQRIARAARQFDFDAALAALTTGAENAGLEI